MNRRNPLSILLVEDDERTRNILASVLALKFPGFVIHSADNGRTGLECFKKYSSAIVITDVNMPVMNGIDMSREIKAIDASVQLIALTAISDKRILADTAATEIEFDHYIPKPTDYGKLFAAVEQCIAGFASNGVWMSLPQSHEDNSNGPIYEKNDEEAGEITREPDFASQASTASLANTGMRVLVVEDNMLARETTGSLLETYGYDVQLADSGARAIAQLEEFNPDVVLLDIGLPDMNGYQIARHIRSLPGGSDLLLVAVSGYGYAEDLAQSQEAGFDHHLVKPFIYAPLRDLLAAHALSMERS